MSEFLVIPFLMLMIGIIYLLIWFIVDRIKTNYYLHKNQKAWDKYAEGLDFEQRINIFPEWLEEQRRINGTDYYYIPRIMGLKDDTKK